MRMTGRTRFGVVIAIVAMVVAGGCQWTLPAFDAAGTRFNTTDHSFDEDDVAGLGTAWTASLGPAGTGPSTPVSAYGKVIVTAGGRLLAFDGAGGAACSAGSPPACPPVWRSAGATDGLGQPVIIGKVVYALAANGDLHAYDIDGVTGCSGTPRSCVPLGVADDAVDGPTASPPVITVDGTTAYLASRDVRAYPVEDLLTCTSTAAPCVPTWTYRPAPGDPDARVSRLAIASGTIVAAVEDAGAADDVRVVGIQSSGTSSCSGAPVVCTARWTSAAMAGDATDLVIDIHHGHKILLAQQQGSSGAVHVYDRTACEGEVSGCQPFWRTTPLADPGRLASGDRDLYVGVGAGSAFHVEVYDAGGNGSACTTVGITDVCGPEAVFADPASPDAGAPVYANHLVFVGGDVFNENDFDLECEVVAGLPTCGPIRSADGAGDSIVLNGRLHRIDASNPMSTRLVSERLPA